MVCSITDSCVDQNFPIINDILKKSTEHKVTVTVSFDDNPPTQYSLTCKGSMMQMEEAAIELTNKVGTDVVGNMINLFDKDVKQFALNNIIWYNKGLHRKTYYSSFGSLSVFRHLYQNRNGGCSYIPLDDKARIVNHSTPRLAKTLAHKSVNLSDGLVQSDLEENHSIKVSKSFIQDTVKVIGEYALKHDTWNYTLPEFKNPVHCISIGIDGTCMNTRDGGGYR
jgi:patatin-like phospholipase/acyl hydrolase